LGERVESGWSDGPDLDGSWGGGGFSVADGEGGGEGGVGRDGEVEGEETF